VTPADHHDQGDIAPPAGWVRLSAPALDVPDGWSVWFVEETGSTNADLLGSDGAPDRTVLVAAHQTSGRGRLDRRWEAPPGANLLVSILFHGDSASLADVTRRVAIAAVDAVAAVAGVAARLKWPNDVLLGDRKLAGILAQRSAPDRVVVGLGLNVGWAPDGAARLGDDVDPRSVLAELLRALDASGGQLDVHERYVALLDTIGRRVRIELPSGELVGTAVGVDADGRLDVLDACAISHRVDVGDVVHLRPLDG
jgi:BirA family biotin operon repressor/biotin-[acetyl-CoA-carboxylase] ligase